MRATSFRESRVLTVLVLEAGLAFSQTVPKEAPKENKDATPTLKGYKGTVPVVQVNGKSYVEVEALARLTNGALSFKTSQITLTLPAAVANSVPPPVDPAAKLALSKEFLKAAIEELSVIREWRIAILNAVQNNYPLTEDWVGHYGRNAESTLALAGAAVAKDSDREVLPLVTNEFNNMKKLSDQYVGMHKSLAYISPDSLDSDALNQQVLNCAQELASLAASGRFQDVPVCH